MATLKSGANLADPDDVFAALVELHRDLSEDQSRLVNAKLILLLANHIGDGEVIRQAIRAAREET